MLKILASSRNNPPIKVPLRTILIVPFMLQVVLVAGLVGYLSFQNGQQAVNEVTQQLHRKINTQIEQHLHTFLDTPPRLNQLNANALHQGWLNAGSQSLLERYFWEQLQVFTSVSSIYFGNTAGGLVNAGREGAADSQYVIVTDNFAGGPFRKYATDSQGRRANLLTTVPDFDARTRPWYTNAIEKDKAVWSQVYILFTGQDMAISASRPVYDARHQLLGVVSVDLFLSQISHFLGSLKIGKTGQSFIIERSGLLLASSTTEPPFILPAGESAPRRLEAAQSGQPLIRDAAQALLNRFGSYQAIMADDQFEFQSNGQHQFLYISPFHHESGLDWLIVTVIPEADFMAQITANNRTTLMFSGAALLVAVVLGILTAGWITRPVLHLNASAQILAKGEWGQRGPKGNWIAEISELNHSFNRMSEQLEQTWERLTAEIAERKELEAKLRINLKKYQALFEFFPLGVTITDHTGRIIETNQAAERILNIPAAEHQQRRLVSSDWPIIRPDGTSMPTEEYAAVRALQENRLIENVEMGLVKEAGPVTWLNVTAAPLPLEGYGVVVAYGDITERKQIELKLQESEKRYRFLFDNSGEAILLTETNGSVLAANPAASHILGRTEAEICRLGRTGLVDPTDPRLPAAQEERMRTGRFLGELNLLRADGQSFPAELTSVVFRDHEGSLKTSMIIRDITERSRMETALRESEHKFRSIVEQSTDIFVLTDETGRMIEWNPAAERLIGLKRAEVLGQMIWDLQFRVLPTERQTPEMYEHFKSLLQNYFQTGQHPWAKRVNEAEIRRPDGSHLVIQTAEFTIKTERGFLLGSIIRDITERNRMEETLRENKERLDMALKGADLGMWDWDLVTNQVTSNERWAEMMGSNLTEIDSHISSWTKLLHPDDLPGVRQAWREHLAGHTPVYQVEYRVRTKSGDWKWISDTGKILKWDEQGTPLRAAGTQRDITESKQAEAERERLIAKLQATLIQVKRLSGLLPICASCKKIRDDRGYWHQVEVYIHERSEADFSHGICPDCKEKLYPRDKYPYLYQEEEDQ